MAGFRCAIATVNPPLMNYGNRLQNYALQYVLEREGAVVRTIRYVPTYPYRGEKLSRRTRPSELARLYCQAAQRRLLYPWNRGRILRKQERFDAFVHKRIKWTQEEFGIDSNLKVLANQYDYVVTGSDQVWNPYWEGTQPIYFMRYMPEDRRVAYAASFGVSSIPGNMRSRFTTDIGAIPWVSCREDTGCEIVRRLTGACVPQVLDPVFLLDRDEWEQVEYDAEELRFKAPYILSYFLGDVASDAGAMESKLRRWGYRIVHLDRHAALNSAFASPPEFLRLIHGASAVLTDSFHGCAFSVIYEVPLVYYQRSLDNGEEQDMSSRLTSLAKMLGLEERCAIVTGERALDMDYAPVYVKLASERKNSVAFLRDALGLRT